jgi:acyl carrier protein
MDMPDGGDVEVIDDVRSIIAKSLKIPIERLTPDARLDEMGAESLDVIEIVFDLEEKFNISIPFKADEGTSLKIPGKDGQEELEFSTVGDLAKAVERLIEAQASK